MTPDKATALREAAEDVIASARAATSVHGMAAWKVSVVNFQALADPPTMKDLLAERERLLKERDDADRTVRDLISTYPDGWCPPAPLMVRAAVSIARQALEVTDGN